MHNSSDDAFEDKRISALLRFFSLFTEENSIKNLADPQIPIALNEMLKQVYADNISQIVDIA